MKETMPEKSTRTFSKRMVMANILLIWILMFAAIVFGQAEHVINGGFALIGTLFGVYAGVGHLDYRKAIELSIDRLVKGNARSGDAG